MKMDVDDEIFYQWNAEVWNLRHLIDTLNQKLTEAEDMIATLINENECLHRRIDTMIYESDQASERHYY